mmetsp:Transcript_1619/g.4817  ORF Transcript_1619/g.4817 Transcript_1619/m.4817 type:complete len:215 (-) Transcript_1619:2262-2906(-)
MTIMMTRRTIAKVSMPADPLPSMELKSHWFAGCAVGGAEVLLPPLRTSCAPSIHLESKPRCMAELGVLTWRSSILYMSSGFGGAPPAGRNCRATLAPLSWTTTPAWSSWPLRFVMFVTSTLSGPTCRALHTVTCNTSWKKNKVAVGNELIISSKLPRVMYRIAETGSELSMNCSRGVLAYLSSDTAMMLSKRSTCDKGNDWFANLSKSMVKRST